MIISVFCPADASHGEAFGNLLFFQLSKNGENTDHGSAQRRGGIKIFADRNEINASGKKVVFNEQQGVFLAAGETIQFINDDNIKIVKVAEHLL